MDQNELMVKMAYEIGFQQALIDEMMKDAGLKEIWGSVRNFFKGTGPKNIRGGQFEKWKAQQAASGNVPKTTAQLKGKNVVTAPLNQRMRAAK
jgi:hypothetical protein